LTQSGLSLIGAVVLISSSLVVLFTAVRVWRTHSIKSLLFLLVDFTLVSVLPLILINLVSPSFGTIERLLFAGFLFYLATCVCYLLFPSTCERYLLPIASFCLVLGTLQSLVTFQINAGFEFQLSILVYRLMDNVAVATICELFIADFVPVYKHVTSRLNALLRYRLSNRVNRNVPLREVSLFSVSPSQMGEKESFDSPDRFFKSALNSFREKKYKSCIESCDAGVENMIMATLLQLYPTRLETPMPIGEQLSKLESRGVLIRGKGIKQLRRLRNSLTLPCREGTPSQAKWALRVLRMTMKRIESFGSTIQGSVDGK